MHAHDRGGALQIAADKRHVLVAVHVARVGNHAKFAEARRQDGLGDPVDVALVLHAVADEVRHGEDFQVVVFAEFQELRHAAHGAVFIHDFADDARGAEPGNARKVHRGFGLAGANEHTAVARAQRKDMARTGKVLGLGLGIDGGKDGGGAVGGGDAGGDAVARVNGFAEGGAVGGSVDGGHEREMEFVAALFGQREADQAAGVLGHEVDGVGRDFIGGHGQVAFVFAVLVVHQDDHAALANVFDGFFDSGEIGASVSHVVEYSTL